MNKLFFSNNNVSEEGGGIDEDTALILHLDNNTTDETGNYSVTNNNVTYSTLTSWGYFGQFNGTTGYLNTTTGNDDFNILNKTNFTLDFRIKLDSVASGEKKVIYFRQDATNWWGINFYAGASYGFTFQYRKSDSTQIITTYQNSEINDTDWHHVALVKVGSLYAFYVDGNQKTYLSSAYSTVLTTPTMYIGQNGASSGFFTGNLDEIRVQHSNYFEALPVVGLTDTITAPTEPYSEV